MTSPDFYCPFCEKTSPRPQGLAAHVRNGHPRQYPKWLKLPTRLVDAQKRAAAPLESTTPPVKSATALLPSPAPFGADANPALDHLKKAHAELVSRKESIEAQLARMSDLTNELKTVNTQIEALDKTIGVF